MLLDRWGWPLPFLRQFISLYDVIWYQGRLCTLRCYVTSLFCSCGGAVDVKYAVMVLCVVTWRNVALDLGPRPETGSGLDKNPRIQNLELSTSAGALRYWTSLSSSLSSLSLFSSSLTLKLNEVSEKKTSLNVQSRCRHSPHLRLEWGHRENYKCQTADPPRSCPTRGRPLPADSAGDWCPQGSCW